VRLLASRLRPQLGGRMLSPLSGGQPTADSVDSRKLVPSCGGVSRQTFTSMLELPRRARGLHAAMPRAPTAAEHVTNPEDVVPEGSECPKNIPIRWVVLLVHVVLGLVVGRGVQRNRDSLVCQRRPDMLRLAEVGIRQLANDPTGRTGS